jgi:hypothetical protein
MGTPVFAVERYVHLGHAERSDYLLDAKSLAEDAVMLDGVWHVADHPEVVVAVEWRRWRRDDKRGDDAQHVGHRGIEPADILQPCRRTEPLAQHGAPARDERGTQL